jgi:hypothetical protein
VADNSNLDMTVELSNRAGGEGPHPSHQLETIDHVPESSPITTAQEKENSFSAERLLGHPGVQNEQLRI